MPIVKRDADLYKQPDPIPGDDNHICVGDLHGNALKLIYTLVQEGVMALEEGDYDRLGYIYYQDVSELTEEDLSEFKAILARATCATDKSLTLIGDELADRGNNDYFTLLVLKKLADAHVPTEIMMSNHSVAFIAAHEGNEAGEDSIGRHDQKVSLLNYKTLKMRIPSIQDEIPELISSYSGMVKGIGYSQDPTSGQLTIYTHAPGGLETIKGLAREQGITYNDSTLPELIRTIDSINTALHTRLTNGTLSSLVSDKLRVDAHSPGGGFLRMVWNTRLGHELEVTTSGGSTIEFVHGHTADRKVPIDGADKDKLEHVKCIDGYFGYNHSPEYCKTGSYRDSYGSFDVLHQIHRVKSMPELTSSFAVVRRSGAAAGGAGAGITDAEDFAVMPHEYPVTAEAASRATSLALVVGGAYTDEQILDKVSEVAEGTPARQCIEELQKFKLSRDGTTSDSSSTARFRDEIITGKKINLVNQLIISICDNKDNVDELIRLINYANEDPEFTRVTSHAGRLCLDECLRLLGTPPAQTDPVSYHS